MEEMGVSKMKIDGYEVNSTENVVDETVEFPMISDAFRHVDDRGVLTQTFGDDFKPKRCYEIKDRAGVIRGMHGHKKESKLSLRNLACFSLQTCC